MEIYVLSYTPLLSFLTSLIHRLHCFYPPVSCLYSHLKDLSAPLSSSLSSSRLSFLLLSSSLFVSLVSSLLVVWYLFVSSPGSHFLLTSLICYSTSPLSFPVSSLPFLSSIFFVFSFILSHQLLSSPSFSPLLHSSPNIFVPPSLVLWPHGQVRPKRPIKTNA